MFSLIFKSNMLKFNDSSAAMEKCMNDDAFPLTSASNRNSWQEYLQQSQGHLCYICHEDHFLHTTELATFESAWICQHVYCYQSLLEFKMCCSHNLRCPACRCAVRDIIPYKCMLNIGKTLCEETTRRGLKKRLKMDSKESWVIYGQEQWFNLTNMHQSGAIGLWVLCHKLALVTHMKNVAYVNCFCRRLINCQHKGCKGKVHKLCQDDWLQQHDYKVRPDDQLFCQQHSECYHRWVQYRADKILCLQNGCIPGSNAASH